MKYGIFILAIVLSGAFAESAIADVKIKSRQVMSGQTYENTTYIKGKRSRAESMNGMMINITQCDLRRTIRMNPNAKTFTVDAFGDSVQTASTSTAAVDKNGVVQAGGRVTSTITVKDTGERKQMFGFQARHLIITMETVSSPDACNKTNTKMQTDGWYIDAEFVLDCDYANNTYSSNSSKNGGCRDKYEMRTVGTAKRGYPVYEKMTMFDEKGNETMSFVTEVIELSRSVLDGALFEVPADYREVQNAAELYAAAATHSQTTKSETSPSSFTQNVKAATAISDPVGATNVEAKKPGVLRIGIPIVKTGSVGDGISASDLAAAVRATMLEFLKIPGVEVVTLDSRLQSAIDKEAADKECDYVLHMTASHKKGGGGFGGMFGSALGSSVGRVGLGGFGSTAANVAGHVATHAIVSAASVSTNIKSKDELTIDVKLTGSNGQTAIANSFKAKAKSNGDDIISSVIEKAAEAVASILGK